VLAAERAFQTGMFRASEAHAEDPLYVQLRHGFRKKPLKMNGLAPLVKDALEVMAKVPVGLLSSCAFRKGFNVAYVEEGKAMQGKRGLGHNIHSEVAGGHYANDMRRCDIGKVISGLEGNEKPIPDIYDPAAYACLMQCLPIQDRDHAIVKWIAAKRTGGETRGKHVSKYNDQRGMVLKQVQKYLVLVLHSKCNPTYDEVEGKWDMGVPKRFLPAGQGRVSFAGKLASAHRSALAFVIYRLQQFFGPAYNMPRALSVTDTEGEPLLETDVVMEPLQISTDACDDLLSELGMAIEPQQECNVQLACSVGEKRQQEPAAACSQSKRSMVGCSDNGVGSGLGSQMSTADYREAGTRQVRGVRVKVMAAGHGRCLIAQYLEVRPVQGAAESRQVVCGVWQCVRV